MRVSTHSGFRYTVSPVSGASAFTAVVIPSPAFGEIPARFPFPHTVGVGQFLSSQTAFTKD